MGRWYPGAALSAGHRKHGVEFRLADPATWPTPAVTTNTATSRYGIANAWDLLHHVTRRAAWIGHDEDLPPSCPAP